MTDLDPKPAGTMQVSGAPTAEPLGASKRSPTPVEIPAPPAAHGRLLPLALGALGVVYGDIGTSPLYAIKECFHGEHAVPPTELNVLGVLSLVFWSLTVVVTIKYLGFITRADNKGEGGIFALLALVPSELKGRLKQMRGAIVLMALFGAALLYGDGIITPAISVLSAVEGLSMATSVDRWFVVLITCAILLGLFTMQRHGTERVGRLFGPVMLVWFGTIAVLGVRYIAKNPAVLVALDPRHAVRFFEANHLHGMVVLGSVVLCITGGEALYADMGHFGRRPIRLAWNALVFPGLLLNYFGQGALLLESGHQFVANPFYALVPRFLLYPMVALSTAATIIASQALISGAFSLTRQAVQLGYCPRVTIVHTSGMNEGQIYIPEVNTALMVACVGLVLVTQESTKLAAAYGIAVTGTMAITSLVWFFVARTSWHWSLLKSMPLLVGFLVFDVGYFGANLFKFFDGGWFPMVVGAGIFTLMTTWKRGRFELSKRFAQASMPLDAFLEDVVRTKPHRVFGTAVFMASSTQGVPPVLLHHLKHNQVLHQQVVLLSIVSADEPSVDRAEQVAVTHLGGGVYRVLARFGFMQTPNVPAILKDCRRYGLAADLNTTSFFLGRETLLTRGPSTMMRWRKALFAFVARNARSATSYFGLPPGRVVELGMQLDL